MRNRSSKCNMSHSLSSYLGFCNLYAATVADYTLISDSLVFTTVALPVLHRSEDAFTKEAIAFRF